jgi:hypothetical protein
MVLADFIEENAERMMRPKYTTIFPGEAISAFCQCQNHLLSDSQSPPEVQHLFFAARPSMIRTLGLPARLLGNICKSSVELRGLLLFFARSDRSAVEDL